MPQLKLLIFVGALPAVVLLDSTDHGTTPRLWHHLRDNITENLDKPLKI